MATVDLSDLIEELESGDRIRVIGERRSYYKGSTTAGDPFDRVFDVQELSEHAIILKSRGKPYFLKRGMTADVILKSPRRLVGEVFEVKVIE